MALPERYEGRPLLLVIEQYVLGTIDALPPEKIAGMVDIVRGTWGGGGDWRGTIRTALSWDTSIDEAILKNWEGYQRAAREQGMSGSPNEFAMMFADALWVD
jgi:hypothetical protein